MTTYLFRIVLVCIILFLWPSGSYAQDGSEGQRLYQAFVEHGRARPDMELYIRKLKPSERQAIIDHVRYLQSEGAPGRQYDDDTLFWMGDPKVRRKYIEGVRKRPRTYVSVICLSGDPTIIEEIAPSIFVEEPMRDVGGIDTPEAPPSFRMANFITHILKNSPDFTEDVRQWADKQSAISDGPGEGGVEFREVMRQWWRANEQFFREKNYQAVRPGRDWLQDVRDRSAAADAAYEAAQAKAAAATPAPPIVAPSPSAAPPGLSEAEPAAKTSWFGFAITSALVLLLGAALYLSTRRRS